MGVKKNYNVGTISLQTTCAVSLVPGRSGRLAQVFRFRLVHRHYCTKSCFRTLHTFTAPYCCRAKKQLQRVAPPSNHKQALSHFCLCATLLVWFILTTLIAVFLSTAGSFKQKL